MGLITFAEFFAFAKLEKILFKKETLDHLRTKPNTCSYYSVITVQDRLWFKTEEDFLRNTYGIERTDKKRIQKLIYAKEGKR